MDKDLDMIIFEMESMGRHLINLSENIKKYYQGFGMRESEWVNEWNDISVKPIPDHNVLVSWWDGEKYYPPIRAYWSPEHEVFFSLDSHFAFALKVDIWCKIPQLPQEKI